jgi:hypothetical protein
MSLSIEIWRGEGGYLLAEVSGTYSMFGFKELTKRMRLEAEEQQLDHLLIDLTRVEGDIETWEGEHLGEYVALSSQKKLKSALVVVSTEVACRFEKIVTRKGTNIRIFTDRDQALTWLNAVST